MWRILRKELWEHKAALTMSIWLFSPIAMLLGPREELLPFILSTTALAFFITTGIIGSLMDQALRDRLYALLPMSITHISLSRIWFVLIHQGIVFCVWMGFYIYMNGLTITPMLCYLISLNGGLLCLIAIFIIFSDLKFYSDRHYRWLYLWVLVLLFLLDVLFGGWIFNVNVGVIGFSLMLDVNSFSHVWGALAINLCGILGYAAVFWVFNHRHSYLG